MKALRKKMKYTNIKQKDCTYIMNLIHFGASDANDY